ncbi:MAG: hypothetical protein ABII18_05540 [bacterium]|nr:hypothetical protein [bacterium]MBU1918603.1 hypothetical protein [bacterium]
MEKSKRRKIEILIVVGLVVVGAVVIGLRSSSSTQLAQEQALMTELKAVRMAVQLYDAMNKNFPANLKVLTTEKYLMGNKKRTYLTGIQVDKENYPIDSFGSRFQLDPKTGHASSATKGYESW